MDEPIRARYIYTEEEIEEMNKWMGECADEYFKDRKIEDE